MLCFPLLELVGVLQADASRIRVRNPRDSDAFVLIPNASNLKHGAVKEWLTQTAHAVRTMMSGIETNEDGSVKCFQMRNGMQIVADEYVSSVPLAVLLSEIMSFFVDMNLENTNL